ncbi:hypothetical protein DET1467 [Dehalococcoides mccartyi 195]|uniref:Uncharacterized protein n=1 Tax=Dehalococcoides mccartyi (strain ATCC BAA-2266 / KCTC 15142 / 195) TaxID=243164 RepID=Q3Z6H9_DEHM1|nr:hypothetical protein DET1467 [Dehalococcoides mccartyi 195]
MSENYSAAGAPDVFEFSECFRLSSGVFPGKVKDKICARES